MLNIIKPGNTVTIIDTVAIPDAVFIPEAEPTEHAENIMPDLSELDGRSAEILKEYIEIAQKSIRAEAEELKSLARQKAKEIIAEAEAKSAEITENAQANSQRELERAEAEGEAIRENARRQGFAEGKKENAEENVKLMSELSYEIDNMKTMQVQSAEQMYEEVKYFALDIAQKLVQRKISEDDMYLEELAKSAVAQVKDAPWLTVEMSQDLAGLAQRLVLPDNASVKASLDGKTRIIVSASENIIDASIPEQLSNIRKYFNSVDDDSKENR